MLSTCVRIAATALLSMSLLVSYTAPATATTAGHIRGKVVDSVTLQPIQGVCVYLGVPGTICSWRTGADGSFDIDLEALGAQDGGRWRNYFVKEGYVTSWTNQFVSNHGYTYGQDPTNVPAAFPLVKQLVGPRSSCTDTTGMQPPPSLTQTLYLPNITRRFGGATGWYTPFIVQNTGTASTLLEVSFYKFSDGTCVSRFIVPSVAPGTSYANDPNDTVKNPSLPDDAQFSVVVKSYGATVVGVVNEHQGTGDRSEALSYNGFTSGATTVFLPNITRRLFGLFVTPFIIQNLGDGAASVTATFRTFDGSGTPVAIFRSIESGRSKPIDPNSDDSQLGAPGLTDNKQYSVTVTSSQPVAVVVNTHNDAPTQSQPVAYATDGVTAGAASIYGAYAAKNAQGVGRYSTIVVQNLGTTAVTPTITFTPLVGSTGTANTYTFSSPIQPNASRPFDPRFSFSTQGTTNTPCSSGGTDCLADGEYSIRIAASGASLAAAVNVISDATAMGYAAAAAPATKFFLPNLTKSLCFCPSPTPSTGWTTPILLQSVTATTVTLNWYRFSTGQLAFSQTVILAAGAGTRIDPWSITQLAADAQYSVVVDGGTGTVTAIVTEINLEGGDGAMIYEGFPSP